MPGFQAVYEKVGDRVAFVGVNHQDNREGALKLLADTGVRYSSGFDPDGNVAASYGLFGMPTTLFISDQGAGGASYRRDQREGPARHHRATVPDLTAGPLPVCYVL